MPKKESNQKQIMTLVILLIFISSTVGFAIMSFRTEPEQTEQPFKPCVNNSDCVLICNNQPLFINCTDNMCEQTECS
ncbi:hypothetical protein KY331_01055 [Candidatus Woesearchaeota archaeon]|nr:hypothetical protein [Candidatus Woesearchaeota archaeon]